MANKKAYPSGPIVTIVSFESAESLAASYESGVEWMDSWGEALDQLNKLDGTED